MLDKIDGLAGTTPWILKDFRSPRRVLPGIQDFYNMKGIMSDKGEKKKSFFVLKQWYEGKSRGRCLRVAIMRLAGGKSASQSSSTSFCVLDHIY